MTLTFYPFCHPTLKGEQENVVSKETRNRVVIGLLRSCEDATRRTQLQLVKIQPSSLRQNSLILVMSHNLPKALLESSSWNISRQFSQSCVFANILEL